MNRWVSLSMILFVAVHGVTIYSDDTGWNSSDILKILDGIAALIAGVLQVLNFKTPRKQVPYAASFFALFIALYGVKLLLNAFNIYPNGIQTPMITIGFVACIFLWLER